MNCHVLDCDLLIEDQRGMCAFHLPRYVEGLVYENEAGGLVDHCRNDHEMTNDNIRWESSGRKGRKRRRCRECLRVKARARAREAVKVVEIPRPYRPNDEALTVAIRDFDAAQEVVKGKCAGNPGPYMDWEDEDAPTPEEAARLCSGCPLIKACGNHAIAAREPHGVWGGRVIIGGIRMAKAPARPTS